MRSDPLLAESGIEQRYLLALDVAIHRMDDGALWADPLWARDLSRHFAYLADLTVFLPMSCGERPREFVRLTTPPGVRYVEARPAGGGRLQYVLGLPRLAWRTLREVRRSAIVHTGVAGYPIPVGWLAIPIARVLGRKVVVVVESAFWRLAIGEAAPWHRRARAALWERVNRWCLGQADYAAYSHAAYRDTLPSPRAAGGVLFQASWIDACDVVSEEEADLRWQERLRRGGPLRVLLASRLVGQKGTTVLGAAIERLRERRIDLEVDVMGSGPDRHLFSGGRGREPPAVRVLEPLPYGPSFGAALARYDVLLAPSLSDEQPRVVYDAAARAVPSLASDLPGMRACIDEGETGWLFTAGDGDALAERLASIELAECRRRGLLARRRALRFTHDRMHDDRRRDLQSLVAARG